MHGGHKGAEWSAHSLPSSPPALFKRAAFPFSPQVNSFVRRSLPAPPGGSLFETPIRGRLLRLISDRTIGGTAALPAAALIECALACATAGAGAGLGALADATFERPLFLFPDQTAAVLRCATSGASLKVCALLSPVDGDALASSGADPLIASLLTASLVAPPEAGRFDVSAAEQRCDRPIEIDGADDAVRSGGSLESLEAAHGGNAPPSVQTQPRGVPGAGGTNF